MPDTPFRTPDEWRRAREAWIHMALLDDRTLAVTGSRPGLTAEWAREFPCPPEPAPSDFVLDNDGRVWSREAPSVSAEREALDLVLMAALERCAELFGAIRCDWSDPRSECREGFAVIAAARAAVLKRMQPQGDIMEIVGHRYHADGRPTLTIAGLYGEQFQTGQHVRVVRVEEGR